jgi:small-conductance mechanosensitive channel
MNTIGDSLSNVFGTTLGNVIWALIILVVGWVVAAILRSVTTSLLSKTKLDDRLAKLFADAEEDKPVDVDRLGGLLVYYVVLLLAITAFLEQLGLIRVAESLTTFIEDIVS